MIYSNGEPAPLSLSSHQALFIAERERKQPECVSRLLVANSLSVWAGLHIYRASETLPAIPTFTAAQKDYEGAVKGY